MFSRIEPNAEGKEVVVDYDLMPDDPECQVINFVRSEWDGKRVTATRSAIAKQTTIFTFTRDEFRALAREVVAFI